MLIGVRFKFLCHITRQASITVQCNSLIPNQNS